MNPIASQTFPSTWTLASALASDAGSLGCAIRAYQDYSWGSFGPAVSTNDVFALIAEEFAQA